MKKLILLILFLEVLVSAIFALGANTARAQTTDLFNPLKWINVETPGQLIIVGLKGFAAMIGIIAIAFTVFSGFKLVIASNEEAIKTAKESLKWSVGGFVISLLAFTIVSGSAKFLGFTPSKIDISGDQINNPIVGPKNPGDFVSVTLFVMQNFLGIVGFATTLMIIYYGYRYLTAAGNEESIETAKTGLKWSIVGFIITLLAFTIISSIQKLLVGGPPK